MAIKKWNSPVLDFYNKRFGEGGSEDADKLKRFLEEWCPEADMEAQVYASRMGQSWYESEYAKYFLSYEYRLLVKPIVDAYFDGCVYSSHICYLDLRLKNFSPVVFLANAGDTRNLKFNDTVWSVEYHPNGRFKDAHIAWPPRNPVKHVLKTERLSRKALAKRLGVEYSSIQRLAAGTAAKLPRRIANKLAKAFGGDPEQLRGQYAARKNGVSLRFEFMEAISLVKAPWVSEKIGGYALLELGKLCQILYRDLLEILQEAPEIRRCAYKKCEKLFIPTPRSHGQKYCSDRCRDAARYYRETIEG